jgi:hypothetical protein
VSLLLLNASFSALLLFQDLVNKGSQTLPYVAFFFVGSTNGARPQGEVGDDKDYPVGPGFHDPVFQPTISGLCGACLSGIRPQPLFGS